MTRAAAAGGVRIRMLAGFDDPALPAAGWDRLLQDGVDVVFATHAWQRLWWQAMGEAAPLIVLAERDGAPLALAPLYAAAGTLMLIGSGSADYLDFVGRPDEQALASLLAAARETLEEFTGIKLYHLRSDSPSRELLPAVAEQLGLELYVEQEVGAPYAELDDAELVARLTSRRHVRKEEARMRRAGSLQVRAAREQEAAELTDVFLAQHGERWRAAGEESFERPGSRELVRAVVEHGLREGWARLTVLEWRGAPAAFDLSLIRGATQLTWLVSRDASIERYSPGSVLAAHVARQAVQAGIRRLDFGLGEEPYKLRDASGLTRIENWFLYP